jgi:hypothetical protein
MMLLLLHVVFAAAGSRNKDRKFHDGDLGKFARVAIV